MAQRQTNPNLILNFPGFLGELMEQFLPIPRTPFAGNHEVDAVDPGGPRAEK